jgi:RNA polymerase sigma-70 factor (family 1)
MEGKTIIDFREGNKEAFQRLFNTLYKGMSLYAKKFVDNYDDAEDVTQEAFIELWNQRAKFESMNQIKAFLYLSIKNRCINFKKHINIKEKYAQTMLSGNDSSFDEFIIEAEVVQNLNNAIRNLPEQRKQVILLSMQGLKNEEIADSMQISINTVKQQKKIAYKQLREKMASSHHILFLLF